MRILLLHAAAHAAAAAAAAAESDAAESCWRCCLKADGSFRLPMYAAIASVDDTSIFSSDLLLTMILREWLCKRQNGTY